MTGVQTCALPIYLEFETRTHASYGVEPYMYANLLLGVRDAVRDAMGDNWTAADQAAWDGRLAELNAEIRNASTVALAV